MLLTETMRSMNCSESVRLFESSAVRLYWRNRNHRTAERSNCRTPLRPSPWPEHPRQEHDQIRHVGDEEEHGDFYQQERDDAPADLLQPNVGNSASHVKA